MTGDAVSRRAGVGERSVLLTLSAIQFCHLLDFVLMMPLGPQIIARFGLTDTQFGTLVSSYTFAAAISGLAAAVVVDRFDRKHLLLACFGLFTVATLACALAPSYAALLVARGAAGVFGGVLSAQVQTIVADVVEPRRRGTAMGLVMSAYPLSTVVGLPLALALAAAGTWATPFALLAAVSALLMLWGWLALPSVTAHLAHPSARRSFLQRSAALLADAGYRRALAFSALLMLAGGTVQPLLTLYLQANLGLHSSQIPWIYFFGGLASLAGGRLFGPLADRRGPAAAYRGVAMVALVPLAALVSMPAAPLPIVLCVTTLFFLFMSGRMVPGMAMVQSVPDVASRGLFLTLNSSVQTASLGLAAFIGTRLIERDAQGHVLHFWFAGLVSATASAGGIWLAARLRLHSPSLDTRPTR